jgi:hypothetical protein
MLSYGWATLSDCATADKPISRLIVGYSASFPEALPLLLNVENWSIDNSQ